MDLQHYAAEFSTIRDFLRFGVTRFNAAKIYFGHGTDNAWDEALAIILHSLHLPPDSGNEILDAKLLLDEKKAILTLFQRRINDRIPVAYLTNVAYFCGLSFYVDNRVLIPRSPIAEIIEARFKPWYVGEYPFRILDLCTGSGCIGIACAYAFPEAEVTLSDISVDALLIANKNIVQHQLKHRVSTQGSDLFEQLEGLYDIIVSNPPYVDRVDISTMPSEYRHEPMMALESGTMGLDHPIQILREAGRFLAEDGLLVLEVGNSGQHLESLYPGVDFNWVEFERGGHGVLVMSKLELENYAEQLALNPEDEKDDDF